MIGFDDVPTIADSCPQLVTQFITRWQKSEAAERANYQLFLSELCEVLGVPKPEPTQSDVSHNAYVFERDVTFHNVDGTKSIGRIDLYKRGCFVLEAKQGSEQAVDIDPFKLVDKPTKTKKGTAVRGTKGWDDAMVKARGQAEQYARALPVDEGWPAFLIVVDVGHTIELFADFSKSGKTYLPFPDPASFRIPLDKLVEGEQRNKLRLAWTDPLSLDPSRRSAKVTCELADRLARLAKSLEASKFDPRRVAQFLMRCLFTMFAEDVDLIPNRSFTDLLIKLRGKVENFPDRVHNLWESMDKGTYSPILDQKLRRFNGGLFEDCEALPLSDVQLELLIDASKAEWREVEPSIFGTLLERALDPVERHKLGAHFTPRAYVERLVMPTIIEPLREEWDAVRTAALMLAARGEIPEAIETVREFHIKLCETNVLDPACGSGNFLYVALEHMKRLEGDVLNQLRDFGFRQIELRTVNPEHFHGIEVNPRAAAIADLVLWIGYLQWHLRTRDRSQIQEPIIEKFKNIECRDAVLTWDAVGIVEDEHGEPITRWDGRTMKKHPVTGDDVPDDTARVPVMKYINPRKAEWPDSDYIVGNPPYLGVRRMRTTIGDDYVNALIAAYPDVAETADYVMYWWHRAAIAVGSQKVHRFGLITTNSIVQSYSRPVIDKHLSDKPGTRLIFAVADHPWVEASDGAAVQVALTVGTSAQLATGSCQIGTVCETAIGIDSGLKLTPVSHIGSLLRADFDLTNVKALNANINFCFQGVIPGGDGFKLSPSELTELGIDLLHPESIVRRYIIGRDLVQRPNTKWVIDCFGLTADEVRLKHSRIYQRLLDRVKPERDQNPRETRRRNWWLFAENAPKMRRALAGLSRFIATPYTAKHRPFIFVNGDTLPDAMAYAVASDDAFILGVLSSRMHAQWALAAGGTLEDRPRYNSKETFSPFPFPDAKHELQVRIRGFGEQLDAHRKRQHELHSTLTMTEMYNVLKKLRTGEMLTNKEKTVHQNGLVSVLKQIHDDLDAAVFDAYGWPVTLSDEEILERLVALNAERAAEEERGLIRWLRPDFQNPAHGKATQATIDIEESDDEADDSQKKPTRAKGSAKKLPLPATLPGQVLAIRQQLSIASKPFTAGEMAKLFNRAKSDQIEALLQSLVVLGTARQVEGDKFVAA